MKSIGTVFQQFCDESGFRFHPLDHSTFLGLYRGEHGKWPITCHIQDTILYFLSTLPVTVPLGKQSNVLDYLNRINWETAVGNFEMDPSDREVRLRTSIDCADGTLTPRMIAALVYRNLVVCDRYLPGLLHIILTHTLPLDAIRAIETRVDDEEPDSDDLHQLLSDVNLDQLTDEDID